ncbi:auxin-responsive protein SAUR64-like [Pyrus communis]|uniref:auxin-responsive protein SAUR64-like n=1 Tax=Pyrus communis TaxID=23211 RepID=UPI0035BEED31
MDSKMLSPKKLLKYAMKWERRAFMERTAIAYPRGGGRNIVRSNMVSEKGTFVVYTIDERRFVLPLSYLSNHIFQKLFKMSEEEFGLSSTEPITLPCDSFFMNYTISFVKRRCLTIDTEKALLNSIASNSCSMNSSLHQGQTSLQSLLYGN